MKTIRRNDMEQLLNQHVPNLPAEVHDYLSSYLADYPPEECLEDGGEDENEDEGPLCDTITQLLEGQTHGVDDIVSNLVAAIKTYHHHEQSTISRSTRSGYPHHHTTNGPPAPTVVSPPTSLLGSSLQLSPVITTVTDDEDRQETSPVSQIENPSKSKPSTKRTNRKELRRDRRRNPKRHGKRKETKDGCDDDDDDNNNNINNNNKEEDETSLDKDHESAWKECQEKGRLWGGRGHGGRGIRSTENKENIHLHSVTLQFAGNELLTDSPMDIVKGHRYGLIGRNGVGKSTLLKQLAKSAIPGMPHDMRILLVHQQIAGSDTQSALDVLVQDDTDRLGLLQEQEEVERRLEDGIDLEENAQRLSDIFAELDTIDAEGATDRARVILKGLSFTNDMIHGPTANLSGGWRMRLALAQALFVPSSDLILFDECTNHLDLHGLDWLIRYIGESDHTIMVVSHDRSFLDAICTDIVVMEHQRLSYHVGNYSHYQQQIEEKAARETQILDAADRQRSKAATFVQKQQAMANKKNADPNKQRQAKMIKDKKMDRIGNYREDGKRYKLNSLKKLDENYIRLAQKVHIEADDPVVRLRFPNPTWPSGIAEGGAIVRFEDVSFGYNADQPFLLNHFTLSLMRGSKVALVGRNGCGKSTLLRLITGETSKDGSNKITGDLWKHPSLRIGHVTQYSVEELEEYSHQTVVEYAEAHISNGKASSSVIAAASGNIRQYLGGFGLGGKHAHREIGKLSGGERMRLCFAKVLADEPHLLVLDESTNHVDLETLDSMANALNEYEGTVLMVSHNQSFLSGFCKELWILEDRGGLTVNHDDTESFDEMFSQYRNDVLSPGGAAQRSNQRRTKADMAKKATKQKAGARVNTALM